MDKVFITMIAAGIGGFIGIRLKIPAGALIGAIVAVAAYNIFTGNSKNTGGI